LYEIGWIVYCRVWHPLANVPGPFAASFSRLWIGASVVSGRAEHVQRALHQKYGPLVRIAPDEVAVADPQAIKTIYSVKSGFTKTDFYPPFAPNISPHGDHFTQLDETRHAERRKYVNSIYSMSTILESEPYIDACIDVFVEKMANFARERKEIDLGEWIQWWVFSLSFPE
jgi:cytochrome P450